MTPVGRGEQPGGAAPTSRLRRVQVDLDWRPEADRPALGSESLSSSRMWTLWNRRTVGALAALTGALSVCLTGAPEALARGGGGSSGFGGGGGGFGGGFRGIGGHGHFPIFLPIGGAGLLLL